jgi:hypothetical protein
MFGDPRWIIKTAWAYLSKYSENDKKSFAALTGAPFHGKKNLEGMNVIKYRVTKKFPAKILTSRSFKGT